MAFQTLAALAVRVTGIILALYAIRTGGAYVFGATTNENAAAYLWLIMAPMLLLAVASLFMIAAPRIIAGTLIPEPSHNDEDGKDTRPVTFENVEILAAALIGLYFLVQAILDTSYIGTLWYATKQLDLQWTWSPQYIASAVTALIEFIAAIWLLLGGKGIVQLMRWARSAHPTRAES